MNYRADIKDDVVVDMYVNQEISARGIARVFDTNRVTIAKRLKKCGVGLRHWEPLLSEEELEHAYFENRMQIGEIADAHQVHPITISRLLERYGYTSRKGGASRMGENDYPPSPKLSYVLGVIFGDGYTTKTKKSAYIIGLHVMDLDFAKVFRESMSRILGKNGYLYKYEKTNAYRTEFCSKPFYSFMDDTPLNALFEIASRYPSQFIKGFFDSEGNVNIGKYNQPRIEIYNQKREYLDFIRSLLLTFNIRSVVRTKRQENLMYRLCIEDKNSCRLFAEKIDSSIARKNLKFQQIIEQQARRAICPTCLVSFVKGTKAYKKFCCRKHEKKFNRYKRKHNLTREQTAEYFKKLRGCD